MPPRSRDQNDQIRQSRRAAILQAAIPLFALNGYSATNVSDVARAVGVSHGTVFLYFASKEDLFRAAVTEPLAEAEQHFYYIGAATGTPLDRLERMVRDQVGVFRKMEPYVRLTQYVIGQRQRFPELAQVIFDFGRRFNDAIIPIIEEGQRLGQLAEQDPVGVAWSYFSLLQGLILVVVESTDEFWETGIAAALRIFAPLTPVK